MSHDVAAGFDFFSSAPLRRPAVSAELAATVAREFYGIDGSVRELGSNQDRNFLVTAPSDAERWLVKFDNAVFSSAELAAQARALEAVAAAGIAAPREIPPADGSARSVVVHEGIDHRARMLTYVEGAPLADFVTLPRPLVAELGRTAGAVVVALAGLEHPGLDRRLQWDLRSGAAVVRRLAPAIADAELRTRVLNAASASESVLAELAPDLPVQPIHGDITPDNIVVVEPGATSRYGVIDFGDVGLGWRVAELAVTVSSLLGDPASRTDPWRFLDAVAAFAEELDRAGTPLTPAERSAIVPLAVLRGAVLVASAADIVGREPDNAYAVERVAEEVAIFDAAAALDPVLALAAIDDRLRIPMTDDTVDFADIVAVPDGTEVTTIDLGVTSDPVDDGAWLAGEALERDLVSAAVERGDWVLLPAGQPRLTRATLAATAPAVVPTFAELVVPRGAPILAPADGALAATNDGVLLDAGDGAVWWFGGVAPVAGATVAAGEQLGSSRGEPVRITAWRRGASAPPRWVTAEAWRAWRRLLIDPTPLIPGAKPGAWRPEHAEAEHERRQTLFASAQERYFVRPPRIERGWRSLLIDTDGRPYLDVVNNVAAIGHSHPLLTERVSRQLSKLNTNSRFLYGVLGDLVERLVALSPDPSLDTVLLVNSGSEAVDLALRLARLATGRRDVIALREAYHGWTDASDAISTSAFDNPSAAANRPDWVHLVDAPNDYRGPHRGADAGARYAADVAALVAQLDATGTPVGAFITEPILGNNGAVVPPPGYLEAVATSVRAAGGLVIADEVQMGFGRTGDTFWSIERSGIVPDIITAAKAMGASYPVGAVITRADIAEALAADGMFFSSAGGAPVSCVAAIAVLDVIEGEQLQENARIVGAHLSARLEHLRERHELIGRVHGVGLYQGIELVRSRETLEPATAETTILCERMRELGVIVQPASERQNVLKLKPPMTLTIDEADFFVDQLDRALSELAG